MDFSSLGLHDSSIYLYAVNNYHTVTDYSTIVILNYYIYICLLFFFNIKITKKKKKLANILYYEIQPRLPELQPIGEKIGLNENFNRFFFNF